MIILGNNNVVISPEADKLYLLVLFSLTFQKIIF